jgi:hypothetical protein
MRSLDSSSDASEWASRQHFAYISPAVSSIPPPPFPIPPPPGGVVHNSPFQSMTEELRKIWEPNEKQLLRESQAGETKKESNGWEKLPDTVQNMILKLSAVQDDVLPVEPCDSYTKILKQSKVLGVTTVINLELAL